VALVAALGLAIDKDMVTWGADGWRDDAGTFFVVALSLAFLRLWQGPSWVWACATGVLTAGALLTRVTLLSLVAPALLLIVLAGAGPRRTRLAQLAVAAAVAAALAGPYFLNCWRVFGDPLYSVNYHTTFYRARGGDAYDTPMSAGTYLRERLRRDPVGTLTTAFIGVTAHPFREKWTGFDFWIDGLGRVLKWLSAAGLVMLACSRSGWFLLVLLVGSLVPYAFTWTIPGGGEWRFTMHAYPLYLVASGLAMVALVGLAGASGHVRRALRWDRTLSLPDTH
jgi:4-amino-4-deoxy-L-arabinose transferase-like glycosyltransferase